MELIARVQLITEQRLCKCHGQPMHKSGRNRKGFQKYACAVKHNKRHRQWLFVKIRSDAEWRANKQAKERERYYNLSGYEYNELLLKHRRQRGLERMKKRNERS